MPHRPVIAVTGPRRGGIARLFISLGVWLAGGSPRRYPPGRSIEDANFDALIISGGNDLNHALYEKGFCDLEDIIGSERDAQEYRLLHLAYERGLPVFGICRGYQLINVYFGGHLEKDITLRCGPIRYSLLPWKHIVIREGSFLYSLLKRPFLKINTLHHQAIDVPAQPFRVSARDDSGMIQAIEHTTLPIGGVQWHPEYLLWHPAHFRLFRSFIEIANRRRKRQDR